MHATKLHTPSLMAYLLNGITDTDVSIATLALAEISQLGHMYLVSNEADFKERVEYGHADETVEVRSLAQTQRCESPP